MNGLSVKDDLESKQNIQDNEDIFQDQLVKITPVLKGKHTHTPLQNYVYQSVGENLLSHIIIYMKVIMHLQTLMLKLQGRCWCFVSSILLLD